jgi:hypothetical protein
VSPWDNSSITLASYSGLYGAEGGGLYNVRYGDLLAVQAWNSQTGSGPTTLYIKAGYPGSTFTSARIGNPPANNPTGGGSSSNTPPGPTPSAGWARPGRDRP